MTVSLVLPCYNPPAGWEETVCTNYFDFCSKLGAPAELAIVMDGVSPGVTGEALSLLKNKIPGILLIEYPENRGKGYAIRQGVTKVHGDIIIYTDIDFPYTGDSLFQIYNALRTGEADVAVGIKNDDYYTHVPMLRRAISRYLRLLIKIFLAMPVTDTQCGLKGFRREVAPLFLQTSIDRYLFDLEFIRNCFKGKKFKVKAIQVTLNDNVHFRSMNYRILLPEMFNFVKLLFN